MNHLSALGKIFTFFFLGLLASSCGGGGNSDARIVVTRSCGDNLTCTEILVSGDPKHDLGANPSRFRGYGDPSLEYDAVNDELWLSYSWLSELIPAGATMPPADVIKGVRTHLAKWNTTTSEFEFVRAINDNTATVGPSSMVDGWMVHEVSTLALQPDSNWQSLWFSYHLDENNFRGDGGLFYGRDVAADPMDLGGTAQNWVASPATTGFTFEHNLSALTELNDCTGYTEPALFVFNNDTYLGTNCVVVIGTTRREDLERFVLVRDLGVSGYEYVAEVFDAGDAAQFDAQRIEQVDLAYAQNGDVLMIATPIQSGIPDLGEIHLGCHVFRFEDFATGSLERFGNGDLILEALITDGGTDDAVPGGPGACSYDANADTGLMIVRRTFNPISMGIEFSLLETGQHF